jgi:hypothetical protein
VYSRDEETAAEIEDDFSLLIADGASLVLKREVELVVVLPFFNSSMPVRDHRRDDEPPLLTQEHSCSISISLA